MPAPKTIPACDLEKHSSKRDFRGINRPSRDQSRQSKSLRILAAGLGRSPNQLSIAFQKLDATHATPMADGGTTDHRRRKIEEPHNSETATGNPPRSAVCGTIPIRHSEFHRNRFAACHGTLLFKKPPQKKKKRGGGGGAKKKKKPRGPPGPPPKKNGGGEPPPPPLARHHPKPAFEKKPRVHHRRQYRRGSGDLPFESSCSTDPLIYPRVKAGSGKCCRFCTAVWGVCPVQREEPWLTGAQSGGMR